MRFPRVVVTEGKSFARFACVQAELADRLAAIVTQLPEQVGFHLSAALLLHSCSN